MAIWQVVFQFVPQNDKCIKYENLINNESLNILSKTLPQQKHWSDSGILFGDLDKTCVEMFLSDNLIEEFTVKLDLRCIEKNT